MTCNHRVSSICLKKAASAPSLWADSLWQIPNVMSCVGLFSHPQDLDWFVTCSKAKLHLHVLIICQSTSLPCWPGLCKDPRSATAFRSHELFLHSLTNGTSRDAYLKEESDQCQTCLTFPINIFLAEESSSKMSHWEINMWPFILHLLSHKPLIIWLYSTC